MIKYLVDSSETVFPGFRSQLLFPVPHPTSAPNTGQSFSNRSLTSFSPKPEAS